MDVKKEIRMKRKKIYCKDCGYYSSPTWNWPQIHPYYMPQQQECTTVITTPDCTEPHGTYLDTPLERILIKNCHSKNQNNNCKYYKKKKEK
jgi:hypothetical protein